MSESKPESTKRHVVTIIHPDDESLEQPDVLELVREMNHITSNKEDTFIDLLLNSNGGNIYAAYKMICVLRSKCNKLRAIIPFYAKSAATLMVLGADKIIMGHQSELGPLDAPMEHPMVEGIHLSALDGVRPLEFLSDFCNYIITQGIGYDIRSQIGLGRKDSIDLASQFAGEFVKPIIGKLDPLVINMCYRRLQIAERYGQELLTEYMFKDKPNKEELAKETIKELVWEYPEHGYAICCREAKRINLEILEADSFDEWNKFWNLYLSLKEKKEKVVKVISQDIFEGLPNTISAGDTSHECPSKD